MGPTLALGVLCGTLLAQAPPAVSVVPAIDTPVETGDFRLLVLRQSLIGIYDAEQAHSELEAVPESDAIFVLGVNGVESYDWDRQALTLTVEATDALGSAVSGEPATSDGARRLSELKASLGWGNMLDLALYGRGFAVRLGDRFLYGGMFLDATSQMGISYPVIRVAMAEGKATFSLLPVHIPFVQMDPIDEQGEAGGLAIAQEAQEDLLSEGDVLDPFATMILDVARSDAAAELRLRLRNPEVRKVFEAAGRLVH